MATTKRNVNGLQVAAIPAGLSGQALIEALNQRFRQISLATITVTTADAGGGSPSAGTVGTGATDGEYSIPLVTISRTLSGSINSTQATCALDAASGLPSGPFLITFASGECARVRSRTGASITAMDRGWNGTTAAAQANASAATVIIATPNVALGKTQLLQGPGNITLLLPVGSAGPTVWFLDRAQDATGGWSTYPSGYLGVADNTAGDPRHWDASPSTRYIVQFSIGSDGNVRPTGGNGPYSII